MQWWPHVMQWSALYLDGETEKLSQFEVYFSEERELLAETLAAWLSTLGVL